MPPTQRDATGVRQRRPPPPPHRAAWTLGVLAGHGEHAGGQVRWWRGCGRDLLGAARAGFWASRRSRGDVRPEAASGVQVDTSASGRLTIPWQAMAWLRGGSGAQGRHARLPSRAQPPNGPNGDRLRRQACHATHRSRTARTRQRCPLRDVCGRPSNADGSRCSIACTRVVAVHRLPSQFCGFAEPQSLRF